MTRWRKEALKGIACGVILLLFCTGWGILMGLTAMKRPLLFIPEILLGLPVLYALLYWLFRWRYDDL